MTEQYLSIFKAAKLMGMKRSILQHKMHIGEIETFEGKVSLTTLKTHCPTAHAIDTSEMLERMQIIKDNAYASRIQTAQLPDAQILFQKLRKAELNTKLERKKSLQYLSIISELRDKLQNTEVQLQGKQKEMVGQLLSTIATKLYQTQPDKKYH